MSPEAQPLRGPVLLLTLLVSLLLAATANAAGSSRGYKARACGLDMNRNGVVGEAAGVDPLTEPGDCNVCDGGPNHPTHPETGTPDPDGDGIEEDLIYVDADLGNDVTGTGSALAPLRTLTAAWDLADGPGDGAEDIVCFRGTTGAFDLTPPEDFRGLDTTYVLPAQGSDARDWILPRDPTLLVGWDYDDDGCYPPYDDGTTDTAQCGAVADIALLSGNTSSARRAFHLAPNVSYFEVAHLELERYGQLTTVEDSGFVKFASSSEHDYLYFHDLELRLINAARSSDSGIIAIDLFNTNLHWVNFTNLLFQNNGGWFVRGAPHQAESGQSDAGPLRFKGITRIMRGPNTDGATTSFKPWGYITGVEVLDSVFDLNTAAWTPLPGSGNATVGILIVQCNQDWVVRNNEFIDFWGGIRVDGSSDGFCDNATARPTTDIVLDGNILRNTYSDWSFGHYGISIQGDNPGEPEGDAAGEVIGNVTVINNFISSVGTNAWESCIDATPSNNVAPVPGIVRILNNTCHGPIRRGNGAALLIGARADSTPQLPNFLQQNWVVQNNVVNGLAANDHNIVRGYIPNNWNANKNVFDPDGRYAHWINSDLVGSDLLSEWQEFTLKDIDSKECNPLYQNPASGDFHLTAADTCAQDFGENRTNITAIDVDGDPRPATGAWDAGADERGAYLFANGFESGDLSAWCEVVF